MIAHLHGQLIESLPTRVVIDVNGVGYEVLIPLSTFDQLPLPPAPVKLLTNLQVREDEQTLYGFLTAEERDLFRLLVHHVSGVGPKLALAVLSGSSPAAFRQSVVQGDVPALSKIKGLGKKTAERIVLELRDKVGVSQAWAANAKPGSLSPELQLRNDTILALIALGYKESDAAKVLDKVATKERESVETWVRAALQSL